MANVMIGGNFSGLDAGYTQCIVELAKSTVTVGATYTADVVVYTPVSNPTVHQVQINNLTLKP